MFYFFFRMHLNVENHEVIYADDSSGQHSFQLDLPDVTAFLEHLFKHLFMVAVDRQCHRCLDACGHAMSMHIGRPFNRDFHSCIPT